jgi:parvulin-like peptidyl-prolyl isomerase
VFSLAPGDWVGPFRSDFGVHLVRLHNRTEARLPPYEELEAQVADEFAAQRRAARNEAAYREMRARYDVVIEEPPPAAAPTE